MSVTHCSSTAVLNHNLEVPAKLTDLDTPCRCHYCRHLVTALVNKLNTIWRSIEQFEYFQSIKVEWFLNVCQFYSIGSFQLYQQGTQLLMRNRSGKMNDALQKVHRPFSFAKCLFPPSVILSKWSFTQYTTCVFQHNLKKTKKMFYLKIYVWTFIHRWLLEAEIQ